MRYFTLAVVFALASAVADAGTVDTGTHALHEISAGVYAASPTYGGSNAMIVIDDDFVLVVDSHSSPAGASALIDSIRSLTDAPVRYVVNTHWHVDHHTGNAAYREAFPDDVVFIAHDTTREDIPTLGREQFEQAKDFRLKDANTAREMLSAGRDSHGAPLSAAQREALKTYASGQTEFAGAGDDFEFTLPNLTLSRKLTIHGQARTIDIHYFHPAHTRGDIVVHLPEEKILAAGDILTKPILWTWASYPSGYTRTLQALKALDAEHTVIGHGGPVVDGQAYLETALGFMETVVGLAGQLHRQGGDKESALDEASSDPSLRGFREAFVGTDPSQAEMFDRMVGWTFSRAWDEQAGELPNQ